MSEQIGENSNGEILEEIASLRGYVDTRLSEFVTTKYLEDHLQRLGMNVMATLSSQLRAMMHDAMSTAIKEEMHTVKTQFAAIQDDYERRADAVITKDEIKAEIQTVMQAEQAKAREERREDFQRLFNYVKVGIPVVVGVLTMINLVGSWIGAW